jgi:hypothetical protein
MKIHPVKLDFLRCFLLHVLRMNFIFDKSLFFYSNHIPQFFKFIPIRILPHY